VKLFDLSINENEAMTLYATVPASGKGFSDKKVGVSRRYRYWVKIIFLVGSESLYSEEREIQFRCQLWNFLLE
jgi:hypothetical protein